MFCDADDMYKSNACQRIWEEMSANPVDILQFGTDVRYEKTYTNLEKQNLKNVLKPYFVKSFPVLSKGFEIETEMTIHAVEKNMCIENVIIEYRDRPEGSESKLNTYSDGIKVLKTIGRLYKNYRPMNFFGMLSALLGVISLIMFIPVLYKYIQTGMVPNFPTLIVSGFVALAAMVSFFSGLILSEIVEKERREYEFRLQMIEMNKEKVIK